jgi:hypothetical protein
VGVLVANSAGDRFMVQVHGRLLQLLRPLQRIDVPYADIAHGKCRLTLPLFNESMRMTGAQSRSSLTSTLHLLLPGVRCPSGRRA